VQRHLISMINRELLLYKLNATRELDWNPFLSHWVEVVRRWEGRCVRPVLQRHEARPGNQFLDVDVHYLDNHNARLNLVRAILLGRLNEVRRLRLCPELRTSAPLSQHTKSIMSEAKDSLEHTGAQPGKLVLALSLRTSPAL
jgi:hypothetical protein